MTILELAISAARAAGEIIRLGAKDLSAIEIEEKTRFDYVSKIDRESEVAIRNIISEASAEYQFLGEETGFSGSENDAGPLWIVDPLDGTTNFLRGIPHYAVSIAIQTERGLEHAVVFDVAKDEMFVASLGQGATLNGRSITLPEDAEYSGALLSTGVPFSGQNLAEIDAFTDTAKDLLAMGTSGIRRLGSAALDLAYVAAGRYDGYWEANLKPWDIAAGALIVLEAGGKVGDFSGAADFLDSGDIVAAPSGVFEQIVSVTSERYSR